MHATVPVLLIAVGAIFVLTAGLAAALELPAVKTRFVEVQNLSIPALSKRSGRVVVGATGVFMIICGVSLNFLQMALASNQMVQWPTPGQTLSQGQPLSLGVPATPNPPAASPDDSICAPTSAPQARISVVAPKDDSDAAAPAYAFTRSADGTIASASYDSTQSAWSGFSTLTPFPPDAHVVSNPAAVQNQNGHLEVFAIDSAGNILDGWQSAPGSTTWKWDANVTGAGTKMPGTACGDPSAVLTAGGEVALAVRLNDGDVAFTIQSSPNGTWTPWEVVDAGLPTAAGTAGDPVLFADPDHGLDLFAVNASRHLVIDELIDGAWGTPRDLGAPAGSPGLMGVPTPVSNQDAVAEIYVEDTDGSVRNVWWNTTTSDWQWGNIPVGGSGTAFKATGPITAVTWPLPARHVELFAQSGQTLFHTWQSISGTHVAWEKWASLSVNLSSDPSAFMLPSGPAVVYYNENDAPAFIYSSSDTWFGEQLFSDGP